MRAAQVENGLVVRVIVGDPAWAADRLGGDWVGTDVKVGVGWTHDDDGFRPPQPYPSWTWDGTVWQPPIPMPNDGGNYGWDEDQQTWVTSDV